MNLNTQDTSAASAKNEECINSDALSIALLAEGLKAAAMPAQREVGLHKRLQSRVSASAARHRGVITVRHDDRKWQTLTKGVRACVLHDGKGIRSALVEFAPGSRLPSHRHLAHEECVVLSGSLTAGDIYVGPHDYHLALCGSKHQRIVSEEGALIFLRGTSIGSGRQMMRELVSAWLPGLGAAPLTVRSDDDAWQDAGAGTRIKPLWVHGESASVLVSLAPGAHLPLPPRPDLIQDKEFLTLRGEAFVGDLLLREGEYQLAPRDARPDSVTSEAGGVLFVHTSAALTRQ